jgi:hypothetical protein
MRRDRDPTRLTFPGNTGNTGIAGNTGTAGNRGRVPSDGGERGPLVSWTLRLWSSLLFTADCPPFTARDSAGRTRDFMVARRRARCGGVTAACADRPTSLNPTCKYSSRQRKRVVDYFCRASLPIPRAPPSSWCFIIRKSPPEWPGTGRIRELVEWRTRACRDRVTSGTPMTVGAPTQRGRQSAACLEGAPAHIASDDAAIEHCREADDASQRMWPPPVTGTPRCSGTGHRNPCGRQP